MAGIPHPTYHSFYPTRDFCATPGGTPFTLWWCGGVVVNGWFWYPNALTGKCSIGCKILLVGNNKTTTTTLFEPQTIEPFCYPQTPAPFWDFWGRLEQTFFLVVLFPNMPHTYPHLFYLYVCLIADIIPNCRWATPGAPPVTPPTPDYLTPSPVDMTGSGMGWNNMVTVPTPGMRQFLLLPATWVEEFLIPFFSSSQPTQVEWMTLNMVNYLVP